MNNSDDAKIVMLSHTGISVCLVTKPSKNAATIKMGTMPIATFMPSLAPFFNETTRLYVLGNKRLLPKIMPAAPAMMIDEISKVPCIQTTRIDFIPKPLLKK